MFKRIVKTLSIALLAALTQNVVAQIHGDTIIIVELETDESGHSIAIDTSTGYVSLGMISTDVRGLYPFEFFSPVYMNFSEDAATLHRPDRDRFVGATLSKGSSNNVNCACGNALDPFRSDFIYYFAIDCYSIDGSRLGRTQIDLPFDGQVSHAYANTSDYISSNYMTKTLHYAAVRHQRSVLRDGRLVVDSLSSEVFVTDHQANVVDTVHLEPVIDGRHVIRVTDLAVRDEVPALGVVGYTTPQDDENSFGDSVIVALYDSVGTRSREWYLPNNVRFSNNVFYPDNPRIEIVDLDHLVVSYPLRDSTSPGLSGGFGVTRIIGLHRDSVVPIWEYFPKYDDFRRYYFHGMVYDTLNKHVLIHGVSSYPVGRENGYDTGFLYLLALDPFTGVKKWERLISPYDVNGAFAYEGPIAGPVNGFSFGSNVTIQDDFLLIAGSVSIASDPTSQFGEAEGGAAFLMRLSRDGCYRGDCGNANNVIAITDLAEAYASRIIPPKFSYGPSPQHVGQPLTLRWLNDDIRSPESITVTDVQGKEALTFRTDGALEYQFALDIPAGVYFIKWGQSVSRIVVQ